MQAELFAIGDDSGSRTRVAIGLKVDGKALRFRKTIVFDDASGAELFKVQDNELRVRTRWRSTGTTRPSPSQEGADHPAARAFTTAVDDGPDIEVKGNLVDHE